MQWEPSYLNNAIEDSLYASWNYHPNESLTINVINGHAHPNSEKEDLRIDSHESIDDMMFKYKAVEISGLSEIISAYTRLRSNNVV